MILSAQPAGIYEYSQTACDNETMCNGVEMQHLGF